MNERVLEVWAAILGRVAGSRLLLLSVKGRRPAIRQFFQARGVAPERVEFLEFYPPPDAPRGEMDHAHLLRYHSIDIALDPFPYNGMTTTCEALWMGVPVVALIGEAPLGRASHSLLSNIGLAELAAPSERQYVTIAGKLADDLSRLKQLRATLRERMENSVLLDAPRFARNLEAAFRQVWRNWCGQQASARPA